VQDTVMVFAPRTSGTVAGLVAVVPFTVQLYGATPPVAVQVTDVDVAVVLLLLTGAEIATETPGVRVIETVLVSVPNALVQATVMTFEPTTRLAVAGLVAAEPLTVQLIGGVPVVVQVTGVVEDDVLLPAVGAVIVTTGASPRLTVIDLVSEPNALLQTTVMVFAPMTSGTVAGLVAEVPFTVQVIGAVPVEVQVTAVDVAVVLLLLAGAEIVTTGAVPRLTVTVFVSEPNALVQATVMVFAPATSATVAGLVAAAPLTVQLIGAVPAALKDTDVDAAVVFVPSAGELIVVTGASPRVTVTDLLSELLDESVQATVMVFAPGARLTVAGLVAALPFTVQVIGAAPPDVVQVTEVDVAVVFVPVVGAVIVTVRPGVRVIVTVLVSDPNALEQATVMVFEPTTRFVVAGLDAAAPFTVQEIGAVPVDVHATEVVDEEVLLPPAGAVIVTTGAMPWLTVTLLLSDPNALEQATVMVFAPGFRLTVAGLVADAPLTVQATGAVPVDVQLTEVVAAVVLVPLAGAVIVTTGATPRLTVMILVSVPNALAQATVMVFGPATNATVAGLVAAAPLTVQEIGAVPVALKDTDVDAAVVFVPSAGELIVVVGAVPTFTTTDLLSELPVESEQATVMVFGPAARLTVAGLVAALPFTVQVIGGAPPAVVHATEVDDAVVFVPLAGDVIVTVTPGVRVTETVLVSEPNALEQATVMVFAPTARLTVDGLVAAAPLTVQEIGAVPVDVQATDVVDAEVVLALAGAVIVTTGAMPWLTVTDFESDPNALEQATVMVFAPATRATVAGLVAAEPLTVQLIGAVPVDVQVTEVDEAVVLEPEVGAVIVTTGATPRLTVMILVSVPNALVQVIVIVFAPATRATVAGLVAVAPFTVQVIGGVPVTVQLIDVDPAVVFEPSIGEVIVMTGAMPRVTTTDLLSLLLDASEQATVMVFAPCARLTVVGLVAALPFTVQVTGATPPDVVHVTEVVGAVVLVLLPGAVIVIASPAARMTFTTLVSVPNELVQVTVMAFAPFARLTVAGLVAAAPLTVQLIGVLPVDDQMTCVVDAEVVLPSSGAEIDTTGASPRLTVTDALFEPNALAQATVMTFAPGTRLTVAGLVAAAPLTVQVTGAVPAVVQVTEVVDAVVLLLLSGAVIPADAATPRLMTTDLLSEPNAFVQATVMVFAPSARATVAGLLAVEPFTVQEVGGVPVVVHVADVDDAVVFEPSVGAVIVTTGAVPRLTVTDLVSEALVESEQETEIAFAPVARLTVVGLVAEAPLTVQLIGAIPPVVVHSTEVVSAVVLLLLAGAVIWTARPEPRVTVTVLVSAPNALEQATVMTFEPTARLTVAGLVAAEPLTVQETGAVPVEDQTTEVVAELVVLPLTGAEIETTGAMPRVEVIEAVLEPNALVQTTVMVFAPSTRLTVAGLVAAAPFTVQLIGVVPVVVQLTAVDVAVVFVLFGDVIVTTGAMPRLTVMVFVFDPTELVQTTVMVFAPTTRFTFAGLAAAAPLTVQVGAGEPVALNETGIDDAVVLVPSAGLEIVVTGAWFVQVVV